MSIRGLNEEMIDKIADDIKEAKSVNEKIDALKKFKKIIDFRSRQEILKEREEKYRNYFTILVIAIFISTNALVGYLILSAYWNDGTQYIVNNKHERIIDGKVIIALITGVVVQTAASFGILTRYIYGHKDVPPSKAK